MADTPVTATSRRLTIGGGGYTFPRYMETVLPRSSQIDVVEIDPEVTKIVYEPPGVSPKDTRIRTFNTRRPVVRHELQARSTTCIFADAYNDLSIPYHLTTKGVRGAANEGAS
ncbi:MAG: fused MFS/spermidine synthase [Desulfobacterales bacterium]|nr:fused MFS/spermidine synthase [Desulfobacterales bacterium]